MQIFRNRRKDIKPTMEGQNKSLFQLFVPLCLETIFYMLSGMVDTLMLSSVGDQAVGAVGTANTYIGVFIIMYSVVSMGMLAVMTQNIGAGRPGIACQAKTLGLWFNGILGVVMSVFLFFCSDGILYVVGIAPALKEPAVQYLRIVGGGSILNAMIPILAGYLRALRCDRLLLFCRFTCCALRARRCCSSACCKSGHHHGSSQHCAHYFCIHLG